MFLRVLVSGSGLKKLGVLLLCGLALAAWRSEAQARRSARVTPPPPPPPPSPSAARLNDLEARLLRLEDQHLALAQNLTDANTAFRRLITQMDELHQRVSLLVAEPAPPQGKPAAAVPRASSPNGSGE